MSVFAACSPLCVTYMMMLPGVLVGSIAMPVTSRPLPGGGCCAQFWPFESQTMDGLR